MFEPIEGGTYEDIQGLRCYIPPVPPVHLIDGFDKPTKEQKWVRPQLPEEWDDWLEEEQKALSFNPDYVHPKIQAFSLREWERRLNGYWFYNNGKPVYLTGKCYFYLAWWKLDSGYADYHDPDRKIFYFWQHCIEDDCCYGMVEMTLRRDGKTYRGGSEMYEEISKPPSKQSGGIQSKTGTDASELFEEKIIEPWKDLPSFFKPESNSGTDPKKRLDFRKDIIRGKEAKKRKQNADEELRSFIDWKPAKEKAYDGKAKKRLFVDEAGKCLKKGTRVLMYDGSYKKVEDIIVGDVLMGDDSTPRNVLGLGRGREMCYDIVSKKWAKWGCNESHILSVKVCTKGIIKGYSKDQTLNITVRDYLKLSDNQKKHLMLYKVGVEYTENKHFLPPYFLGMWLGDGNSDQFKIHKPDVEIESSLKELASSVGFSYRKSSPKNRCDNHVVYNQDNQKDGFTTELGRLNLKNNKHIPKNYLIDSRKNRLLLLAGLIDTYGYANDKRCYEIVQKNKQLAYDILLLAQSLGIGASLKNKIATMKRSDGTIYKCPVYRIFMFGPTLHEIPCQIPRKKYSAVENPHNNTRNTLRHGFKVVPTGEEDYYGFSIDGNRLFIIEDFQVTHNTDPKEEADVYKRHFVLKPCLFKDGRIQGKMYVSTTVEELDKGGAEFKKLWDESDFKQKNSIGQTKSGLYRYFKSALEGTFYDEYGYPVIENPTPEQRAWLIKKYGLAAKDGARAYHQSIRDSFKDDPNGLTSYMRKHPFIEAEAFYADGDACEFNALVLTKRLEELQYKDGTIRGDFDWKNGVDTDVIFNPNPTGKWSVAWLPTDVKKTNLVEKRGIISKFGKNVQTFAPLNDSYFRAGEDPVELGVDSVEKRVSDMSLYIWQMFDVTLDNPNSVYTQENCDGFEYKIGKAKWQTHRPIAEYIDRPDDPTDSWEETIKAIRFFGCSIFPETNKPGLRQHLLNRGYQDFIKHRPTETMTITTGSQNTLGVASVTPVIQQYLIMIKSYVNSYGHLIPFKRLVKDLLEFRNNNRTKHDPTVAFGFTLMATLGEAKQPAKVVEVGSWFRQYDISGIQSELVK